MIVIRLIITVVSCPLWSGILWIWRSHNHIVAGLQRSYVHMGSQKTISRGDNDQHRNMYWQTTRKASKADKKSSDWTGRTSVNFLVFVVVSTGSPFWYIISLNGIITATLIKFSISAQFQFLVLSRSYKCLGGYANLSLLTWSNTQRVKSLCCAWYGEHE